MSADNMVYLQRCADGIWRAWHGFASGDDPRPTSGFIVESPDRAAAVLAAHDWNVKHYTEYGVVELDPEPGHPMTTPADLPELPPISFWRSPRPSSAGVLYDTRRQAVANCEQVCEDLYTADQMRAFYAAGVRDGMEAGMERAALICEELVVFDEDHPGASAASAIRAAIERAIRAAQHTKQATE